MTITPYPLPVHDITAYLQPFLNPGSTPRMIFPLTGGMSNNPRRLEANTSIDARAAVLVNCDLANQKFGNHCLSRVIVQKNLH